MKKNLLALLVSVVLVATAVAASGNAAKTADFETVGGFAVKLAAAIGTPARTQTAAVATLRAAGVNLQADLSARLTENQAARILGDLGMMVAAPTNPANEVSVGKANQLAASAGLTVSAGLGITADELPTQCLFEKNHGQCVGCCKLALGYDPALPRAGQISKSCARFCKTTPPPTSDPEPEP